MHGRHVEGTEEARIGTSIDRIRAELSLHYGEQTGNITEITDLSRNTFGTAYSPSCSFKAGETNHFMPYPHKLIVQHGDKLEHGAALTQASKSLLRCVELVHEFPVIFSHLAEQDYADACVCVCVSEHTPPRDRHMPSHPKI